MDMVGPEILRAVIWQEKQMMKNISIRIWLHLTLIAEITHSVAALMIIWYPQE